MIRKTVILSLIFISFLSYGNDTLRLVYLTLSHLTHIKTQMGRWKGSWLILRKKYWKKLGLVVSCQSRFPSSNIFNGQADAFISLPTPARLEHVDAADVPVFIGPITLFTYKISTPARSCV